MATHENILRKGSSINKPPGFDGEHYTFWRMEMTVFIKANSYRLWQIIEKRDLKPLGIDGKEKPES